MRSLIPSALFVLLLAVIAITPPVRTQLNMPDLLFVNVDPVGSCNNFGPSRYNFLLDKLWNCKSGTWTAFAGGGGATVPYASGTTPAVVLPSSFARCTGTCTVTVPAPTAAGDQFCAFNGVAVSTAITLAAITGVQYGKTDGSSYGTANTAATATAATGNRICMVSPDTTHWDTLSSNGTWTMN